MGERGPAAEPSALRLLKGEKRPSQVNQNEPKPAKSDRPPSCPSWLSTEAKTVWRRYVPELFAKDVMTEWDREAFAVFCEAVVHHREACKLVDASAVLVRGAHGNLTKNPALQVVRDQATIIRAFGQEFGLTPSSRQGIKVGEGDGDDLFDF